MKTIKWAAMVMLFSPRFHSPGTFFAQFQFTDVSTDKQY